MWYILMHHNISNVVSIAGGDPGFFPRGGPVGHRHIAHRDATGFSGEGTEGGLGGLPQENLEYEVL